MAVRYENMEALRKKENAIVTSVLNAIQDKLDILGVEIEFMRNGGCWDADVQKHFAHKWIALLKLNRKIICREPNSYEKEAISLDDMNVNEKIEKEVDVKAEEDTSISAACSRPTSGEEHEHFSGATTLSKKETKDPADNEEHDSHSEVNAKLEQKVVEQDKNSGQDWKATADDTQSSRGTADADVEFIASGREKPTEALQIVPIHLQNERMLTKEKWTEGEDKKDNLLPSMWKFYILPYNIYMIGVKLRQLTTVSFPYPCMVN